jgi:hypothetical protein
MNGSCSRLPRYVFNRSECSVARNDKGKLSKENYTGRIVQTIQGSNWKFGVHISKLDTPFVYEHIVEDKVILPGALYGEIALEIGRNIWDGNVEDLEASWNIMKLIQRKKTYLLMLNSYHLKKLNSKFEKWKGLGY